MSYQYRMPFGESFLCERSEAKPSRAAVEALFCMRAAIGADLGGTKMAIGVVDSEPPGVASRHGADHRARARRAARRRSSASFARRSTPARTSSAIGLGIPCTIDRERGLAIASVNLPIVDVPIRDLIAERLGLPVFVDNDANVAALAEHRFGAGRGARNLVLLTIGTGIGGGLILDGELYRGSTGAGAELGHMVIDENGPPLPG